MNFYIDKAILERAPRTRLGVVRVEGCKVGFGHTSLDDMRLRVVNRVRDEISGPAAVSNVPQIAGVEHLMSHFDGDMRRPKTVTEFLLGKILEGGPLPVENDAVDVATLLNLYYKLPVIALDEAAISGDLGLVVGRGNREFEPLQGHARLRTAGRIFLADDLGYVEALQARGKRATVTERTRDVCLVALFPENVGDSIVRDFIRRGGNWMESLCRGEVAAEGMVGEAEAAS